MLKIAGNLVFGKKAGSEPVIMKFYENSTRIKTGLSLIIKKKTKRCLLITSGFSVLMAAILLTDWFYFFLLKIYDSINRYYFLSHRITYFTETGLLLHVDFYQRVFIAMALLLSIFVSVILIKIRLKTILILLIAGIIAVNFTFLREEMIIKRQEEAFDRVEARNYYQVITTIIKSKYLRNYTLSTNIKELLDKKLTGTMKLNFADKFSPAFLSQLSKNDPKSENSLVFLKQSELTDETKDFINTQISETSYITLFDDKEYILFEVLL